jgi:hypothetical protein
MFLERVGMSDVRSSRQEISCGGYYNDIAVVIVVVIVVERKEIHSGTFVSSDGQPRRICRGHGVRACKFSSARIK